MVENYTKDIKESIYHGAVVSALAIGYTMLGWCKISGNCSTIRFYEGLSNQAKNNSQ